MNIHNLKPPLEIVMNLGGILFAFHRNMWIPLSLHSPSPLGAFIITFLRLNYLCILHTPSHPPLRTMAFPQSNIYPPPPFGSPLFLVPVRSPSTEEIFLATSELGERTFPTAIPLLQDKLQVHSSSWVDSPSLLHSRVETGGSS